MSGSAHPMAARLKTLGKLVGSATVPGQLYNFGYYPAAIFDAQSPLRIKGEIHRLISPEASLRILDVYEGCSPHDAHPHFYRRELVPAQLSRQRSVFAWIYVLNEAPPGRAPIPTGRYRAANARLK